MDWVAVDQWDTDNPHTLLVLKGRTASGEDLVIAPNYMAHGMRMRASKIATEWLGPHTELEIRQSLLREADQQRLTGLEQALAGRREGRINLTGHPVDRTRENARRASLQGLAESWHAERVAPHRSRLRPGMAAAFSTMGEPEDVLDAMRRALEGRPRKLVVHGEAAAGAGAVPVIGRIVGKGLTDEPNGRGYRWRRHGRAHHLQLPVGTQLSEFPVHAIVEASQQETAIDVDRTIVALLKHGIYDTAGHLDRLRRCRRRPAARGSWNVCRWQVADLLQSAQQYDARRTAARVAELRSYLPIEHKVRAIGATWLDRNLVTDAGVAPQNFGAEVRGAIQPRIEFSSRRGWPSDVCAL